MKDGAQEMLGRTIKGVVIKQGESTPRSMLFLVFEDGTYFEFYSYDGEISPTGGINCGTLEDVRRYMSTTKKIVFETYPKIDC